MQEWDETLKCGKESLVDTELATTLTTDACFWSSEHQLAIANTLFQQKDRFKASML